MLYLLFSLGMLIIPTIVADWSIVSPNVATICTGISCTSDKICYIPVAANGVGTNILHSSDGGDTWTPTVEEPFALLLLDIAAENLNVVALGALTLEYSTDGALDFYSSSGVIGAGQCIRSIPGTSGFGAVGDWGLFSESNGPAISMNGGMNFTADNITSLQADSRYGAFPTSTEWIIAAGDWPGEGSDDNTQTSTTPANFRRLWIRPGTIVQPKHYTTKITSGSKLVKTAGSRLHLLQAPDGTLLWAQVRRDSVLAANAHDDAFFYGQAPNTWEAQLARTSDAGQTWNVVFSKVGAFYFNDIACIDANNCCVVAETGTGTNGTDGAGTFIYCTTNGGVDWTETNVNPDPDSSLIGIDHIGPNEYWAVGGELGLITPLYTTFWHTTDSGVTWTKEANFNLTYGIDIACVPGENCWALLLDVLTQESSVARLNTP
jgi:photosystem II stability/assembly factor-like uncharacterized protein